MHLQAKSASEKEPFCLAVYMEMASLRSAIMIFLDALDATASNTIVKIHTHRQAGSIEKGKGIEARSTEAIIAN